VAQSSLAMKDEARLATEHVQSPDFFVILRKTILVG
jgi:hypothetical protein